MWSALLRTLLQFHRFYYYHYYYYYYYLFSIFQPFFCCCCCFLRFSPCLADIAMRTTALCAVLSLLVVLFSTTEVNSCYVKANGCSIPGNLPFFYKRTFKPACDKHDVCYYCVRLAASFSYYKFIRMTATMSHLHK